MPLHDADGHARSEIAARTRAQEPRADLVAWLLGKLERERYAEAPEHSDLENARRRGWNARCDQLAADVRLYVGLAEMAASDVDARFDDGGVI